MRWELLLPSRFKDGLQSPTGYTTPGSNRQDSKPAVYISSPSSGRLNIFFESFGVYAIHGPCALIELRQWIRCLFAFITFFWTCNIYSVPVTLWSILQTETNLTLPTTPRQTLLLSLFYRWGNWNTGAGEVTQLLNMLSVCLWKVE